MTCAVPDPVAGPTARESRWRGWLAHRGFELACILGIGGVLAYDRYLLCKQYLFQYTDEDQSAMWYAAHELLHGRIAEPCFYGQDYNCCLEGWLAAPLVALHVPYNVACPLVTVMLGLLPFLLIALVAWRRGHFIAAAAALLLPLMMPVRYGMICGIPRGFINGIAVAALPMLLLLPRRQRITLASGETRVPAPAPRGSLTRLRATLPALRYFVAGALAVAAFQVNPNCTILLVPVAVYAALTRFLDWSFWVFGLLGLAAAAPYPYYVHQFYHVYHPDYVLYLRGIEYQWGWNYYHSYLNFIAPRIGPSPVLADLVPLPISGVQAPRFLILAAAGFAVLMALRFRIAGLCALLAAVAIVFISFAYERVHVGEPTNTASYPYSRMYLALPVVLVWLFFLTSQKPWRWATRPPFARWTPWMTRVFLAALLGVALYYGNLKQRLLPDAINTELRTSGFVVCPAVPVGQLLATAAEVKKIADAQHADLLIVGGDDKQKNLAYAMPPLYDLETLFPEFERRTARLIEESQATHHKILLVNFSVPGAVVVGGRTLAALDAEGHVLDAFRMGPARPAQHIRSFIIPQIMMLDLKGANAYTSPALAGRMPHFIIPHPTAANPNPTRQIYRPPWPH